MTDPRPLFDTDEAAQWGGVLEPIGLIYSGRTAWFPLKDRNNVLYGLNGAGKSHLLNALSNGLRGVHGDGALLVDMNGGTDWPFTLAMELNDLTGHYLDSESSWSEFTAAQQLRHLMHFRNRQDRQWPDGIEWAHILERLASSRTFLFDPVGTPEKPRWDVSQVLLVVDGMDPKVDAAMRLVKDDQGDGNLWNEFNLDSLFWADDAPLGATAGFLINSLTWHFQPGLRSGAKSADMVFGTVVTDEPGSIDDEARAAVLRQLEDDETDRNEGELARLETAASRLESRANLVFSTLLDRAPALELRVGSPLDWFAGRQMHWKHSGLSDAQERWARVAVRLAATTGPAWLLLDEPETGLHRTAEAHLATALASHEIPRLRVFAASHSPEVLDAGVGTVHLVQRAHDGARGVVRSLSEFQDVRLDLGLTPSDLLRRTAGFLLVEGEHDLAILESMFGQELGALRVEILALRGASKLKTVIDSQFLYQFTEAALFPLLDDLALEAVTSVWVDAQRNSRVMPLSNAVGKLAADLRDVPGHGKDFLSAFLTSSLKGNSAGRVRPLGIPESDVLLCLPVDRFVRGADSWEELRVAATKNHGGREVTETDFKKFLKSRGADLSTEHIRSVAAIAAPHPSLQAIIAAIDEHLSGSPLVIGEAQAR